MKLSWHRELIIMFKIKMQGVWFVKQKLSGMTEVWLQAHMSHYYIRMKTDILSTACFETDVSYKFDKMRKVLFFWECSIMDIVLNFRKQKQTNALIVLIRN